MIDSFILIFSLIKKKRSLKKRNIFLVEHLNLINNFYCIQHTVLKRSNVNRKEVTMFHVQLFTFLNVGDVHYGYIKRLPKVVHVLNMFPCVSFISV